MKTKTMYIAITGLVLVIASVILTIFFMGSGCGPIITNIMLIVIAVPVACIAIVFVLFLKMNAKQGALKKK